MLECVLLLITECVLLLITECAERLCASPSSSFLPAQCSLTLECVLLHITECVLLLVTERVLLLHIECVLFILQISPALHSRSFGFSVAGCAFRVSGSGFRMQGFGFRVKAQTSYILCACCSSMHPLLHPKPSTLTIQTKP